MEKRPYGISPQSFQLSHKCPKVATEHIPESKLMRGVTKYRNLDFYLPRDEAEFGKDLFDFGRVSLTCIQFLVSLTAELFREGEALLRLCHEV